MDSIFLRRFTPARRVVFFLAFPLLTIGAPSAGADDAAIAEKLRDQGAKVQESKGVVTTVEFRDCSKLNADDFRRIGQLAHLKRLTLYGQCLGLNDQTLPLLAGLSELEELQTDRIQVSDEGLKTLTALKELRGVAFFHISWGMKGFTGAGLAHLAGLPKLERLTVAGTPFNDEGMTALGKLTQLRKVGTWHTAQTAAGTAKLHGLKHLRELRLGQTIFGTQPSLNDDTLGVLAQMKSLEILTLDEARLSLPALRRLKALPNLKKLALLAIDLPASDVEALRSELPGVAISHMPPMENQMKLIRRYFDKK